MELKEVVKVNKSSDDIWRLLRISVDSKNWATLETNLNRLHALQKYYCELLTIQASQIRVFEADEKYYLNRNMQLEKENFKMILKTKGMEYQEIKKRVEENFTEL
jgi:hypothetical protein